MHCLQDALLHILEALLLYTCVDGVALHDPGAPPGIWVEVRMHAAAMMMALHSAAAGGTAAFVYGAHWRAVEVACVCVLQMCVPFPSPHTVLGLLQTVPSGLRCGSPPPPPRMRASKNQLPLSVLCCCW